MVLQGIIFALVVQGSTGPSPETLSRAVDSANALLSVAGNSQQSNFVALSPEMCKLSSFDSTVGRALRREAGYTATFETGEVQFYSADGRISWLMIDPGTSTGLPQLDAKSLDDHAESIVEAAEVPGEFLLESKDQEGDAESNPDACTEFVFRSYRQGLKAATEIHLRLQTKTGLLSSFACLDMLDLPDSLAPRITLANAQQISEAVLIEKLTGQVVIGTPTDLQLRLDSLRAGYSSRQGFLYYASTYNLPGYEIEAQPTDERAEVVVDAITGEVVSFQGPRKVSEASPTTVMPLKEPELPATVTVVYKVRSAKVAASWKKTTRPPFFDGEHFGCKLNGTTWIVDYDLKRNVIRIGDGPSAIYKTPDKSFCIVLAKLMTTNK